jgi:hypothetical protein
MSGIDESIRRSLPDTDGPRRESESATMGTSNALGSSIWPGGRTEAAPVKKLDLGPPIKPQPEQAMQEIDEEL